MGAGLGGGSADGAFMLKLLNEKFHLKLTTEQLIDRALHLGSDCPFFIINKPCHATGRGEFLQSLKLDLSAYSFMVVHPGIHISTAWAFTLIEPTWPEQPLPEILQQPIEKWKDVLKNDFESAVFPKHPAIKTIKDSLYRQGALYASLTGSGSAVYGIFEKNRLPAQVSFPATWRIHTVE